MFAPLYIYSYVTGALATRTERSHNERGASFTEYVVLIAGVVAVVVAAMVLLKGQIESLINGLDLTGAGTTPPTTP